MTEIITNVIRHAQAHQVEITFFQTANTYFVTVQDDGKAKNYLRAGSNGISGMRSHMHEADGTFSIDHNRQGTLVSLTLPKELI